MKWCSSIQRGNQHSVQISFGLDTPGIAHHIIAAKRTQTSTSGRNPAMHNPVRDALKQGKVQLGAWLNLGSSMAAETMAGAGFDWLCVDAEHSLFDLNTCAESFRAIEARGIVPFVRAWDHDTVTMARLLDAGAYGIVVPHVSTPEEADKIAKSMRYPSRGTRSAGTGRIAAMGSDYRTTADDQIMVIPQIEDMEGVNNAEAIFGLEEVDVGFIGPNDLALSMGVEPGHPDHEAALQKILAAAKKVGKPCGMPARATDAARQRISEGFLFLDIASDLRLVDVGSQEILEAVRA